MAAPAPQPPPNREVLIDDLVELFLLRLPPEEPEVLASAALVSRQWFRVITGAVFRRRYREIHHRSPPLLGYLVNLPNSIRFVPLSLLRPRHAVRRDVLAVHSSHGRVLLRRTGMNHLRFDFFLSVWDLSTDEQLDLPVVPCPLTTGFWDAAVVCAAVGDGDGGCSHLHCNFKVVFVGISGRRIFSCLYSSEAGRWSDPSFVPGEGYRDLIKGTCVLVGSAVYFRCGGHRIIKYDFLTDQMCEINVVPNSEEGRAIELRTRLPGYALGDPLLRREPWEDNPRVVGFAETGAGVMFIKKRVGYFTIQMNSGRTKKVGEILGSSPGAIVPYASFCTPAPGAVSTSEGPGAVVEVSTDEVPGARVVVSTDESPAAGMCQVHKKLKLQD